MRIISKVATSSVLFYIILVIAFTILLVFFFIFKGLVNEGAQYKMAFYKQKQLIESQRIAIDDFKDILQNIISVDGDWINPEIIITSENGEVHYIHDFVSNNPKLFFHYSKFTCDICVEKEVSQLKTYIQEIGTENVIVIASFESKRVLSAFKKINDFEFEIYSCEEQIFGIEESSLPYYFILNSNCQIERFFLPQNSHSLSGIVIKLFDSSKVEAMHIIFFSKKSNV